MGTNIPLTQGGGPGQAYQLTYRTPGNAPGTGVVTGTGADWFGPLNPMQPVAPPDVKGRILDYPSGYNLNIRPRSYEAISFEMLRNFADGYDLLRLLIETRKDQMARLTWNIVPRDKGMRKRGVKVPEQVSARIKTVEEFFLRPDQENFWGDWLRMLLEDLFVIDAPTLYRRRTYGGDLFAFQPLDGGTIKRVIDDWGNTPEPPTAAYQQVLKGYPAVDYTKDELIYRPRNRRTHKVYGYSPVEQIVMTINIGLRRQVWQLESFTEGNVPEALIGTPETWTPDQIAQFQTWFDSVLQGNTGERRRARFVPGELAKGYVATKPTELFGQAEEWLIRVMCFAFNISPQPFVQMMNRATAETAQETAALDGLTPIQDWVKSLMDTLLIDDFNSADLEFVWEDEEELDPNIKSQIVDREAAAGRLTFNEARREMGDDPIDHPNADRPMYKATDGSWHPIFETPEEEAERKAMAAQIAGGTPGDDEGGDDDDDPDGGPGDGADPEGNEEGDGEPGGGEVAEKSDRPFSGPALAKAGKASTYDDYPDPLRPFAAKVEKRLSRGMAGVLQRLGRSVVKQVRQKLEALTKADIPDEDLDKLIDELDLSILLTSQDELEEAIERVFSDAGRIALGHLGPSAIDDLVEQVNDRAVKWAAEHSAELVGISDNPEFSLDMSTRNMVRGTIADGLKNNLGMPEIADLLEESYAFSEDRALTIAATEVTSANSMGALASYEEAEDLGIETLKGWLVLEDGCPICQGNADAGFIPLDQPFPSGDMTPGAHPHCRCVLVPKVKNPGGDDVEKADKLRDLQGRFSSDPGRTFMAGSVVAGIPGVKAKDKHTTAELMEAALGDTEEGGVVEKVEKLEDRTNDGRTATLYICRRLLNADEFIEWAKSQGFTQTLKPNDLHVTIAFSREVVDWSSIPAALDFLTIPPADDREITPLGDKGAVVLRFDSDTLQARWQQLRELGASWDYPSYHPHVSISYQGGGLDLSEMLAYPGELRFGPELYAEVVEDWDTKIEETA